MQKVLQENLVLDVTKKTVLDISYYAETFFLYLLQDTHFFIPPAEALAFIVLLVGPLSGSLQ